MKMNRRFYLISRDKEFSDQFSAHFLINRQIVFKLPQLIWLGSWWH